MEKGVIGIHTIAITFQIHDWPIVQGPLNPPNLTYYFSIGKLDRLVNLLDNHSTFDTWTVLTVFISDLVKVYTVIYDVNRSLLPVC